MADNTNKTLHIIPHAHWDREWYMPFEKHRLYLVELFDTLIDLMEKNDKYTYYHMDGQFIVIEDYLEIRPQMRDRLLALIQQGRIRVGPWYILQDEYLTGGESNVRNMLYGMRLCRDFGIEPERIGYFPDAFGNVAQAPQILRGFGLEYAVFGRGINDVLSNNLTVKANGILNSELIWESPDGSRVVAVLMANWYHNANELPTEENALRERMNTIVSDASRFALTDHLLGMNGTDHQPVQVTLTDALDMAARVCPDVTTVQSNFADYMAAIAPYADRFPIVRGEINGQLSRGACPLICTASAHIDIKKDNYLTEHLLARVTEPVSLLAGFCGATYPRDQLLYAWKTLMQNHPHDSICACSCDEVYDEMKVRFAKAMAVGEGLRDRALSSISGELEHLGERVAVLSLDPGHRTDEVTFIADFYPSENVSGLTLLDDKGNEVPITYTVARNVFTYTLPDDRFRDVKFLDRFTVHAYVESDGVGCRFFTLKKQASTLACPVAHDECGMENEHLAVRFADDGTFALTDKHTGETFNAIGMMEDSGDVGNLYNYVQPEGDVTVYAKANRAVCVETTPYSVTFRTTHTFADDLSVDAFYTLAKDARHLSIRCDVHNARENHRLRMLFPTLIDTDTVLAEGQFDVTPRSIQPSEVWENPCNAQRMQAFVAMESETRSLAVATRGINEYEALRDGKNTIALTVLRAIGEIGDWGDFPTPKGQKIGSYTQEFAVVPYNAANKGAGYNEAYAFAYPSTVAVTALDAHDKIPENLLRVTEPMLRISALKASEDRNSAVVRFFYVGDEEKTVEIETSYTEAYLTNMAEERTAPLTVKDGKFLLSVKPKQIITVELQ